MIPTLIDKQDSFEIVRDQIVAILVSEVASQQALAITAGKDPALWKLRIFKERTNPQEEWLNETPPADRSPLVNVWFDTADYEASKSNAKQRQFSAGTFNIDCLGLGVSANIPAGGHTAGDEQAAIEVQRAYRLVRNILMAAEYLRLDLPGLVGDRWPQSVTAFQPQIDSQTVQQVAGLRLALRVTFNEFSPQFVPETLELVSVEVKQSGSGEVFLTADYPSTP